MKKYIIFLFIYGFYGCGNPNIEYRYITKEVPSKCYYPKLKTYEDVNYSLSIKEKDNKICIKEWNVCLSKDKFKELYKVLIQRKNIIKKYKFEVDLYNKNYN